MIAYDFRTASTTIAAGTEQQVAAFERAFEVASQIQGEQKIHRQRPAIQGLRGIADANVGNPELYKAILVRMFELAEQIEDLQTRQHYQAATAINRIRDNVATPAAASGNMEQAIEANVLVFDLAGKLADRKFGEGYRNSAITRIRDKVAIPVTDIGQVIAANETVFNLAGQLQDKGVSQTHQTSVIRRMKLFAESHPESALAVLSKALELTERFEDPNTKSVQMNMISKAMRTVTPAPVTVAATPGNV
jgi:hypothetical protein